MIEIDTHNIKRYCTNIRQIDKDSKRINYYKDTRMEIDNDT